MKFLDMLIDQKENIQFQMELAAKFNDEMNRKHREAMLKEQLKAIQEELDDTEGRPGGRKDYRELIEEAGMPDHVKQVALDEVSKLDRQGAHSSRRKHHQKLPGPPGRFTMG